MVNLGFRVKELIGGLDWWKCDGLCVHYFLFLIRVNFDILEKIPLPHDYAISKMLLM